MEGPSATIALVLAETAAGATALLWFGRLWGEVRRGFFLLTSAVALACALLSTLSASAATVSGPGEARLAVWLLAATSMILGLSVSAFVLRLDAAGRVLGVVAILPGVGSLGALADVAPSFVAASAELLAGAAFLGAVTVGLLLGHWYLTDRRLSRDHIKRFTVLLLAAVLVEALALAVFGLSGTTEAGQFSVILGVSGLTTWIALGMVACTGLIAFLIRASLRGTSPRAVQGATGFFYLAVITAFTAEMAAKVGFLG
ncbi:MAG: hypothetical protein ACRDJP_08985 [Actinomycetota bacterium]